MGTMIGWVQDPTCPIMSTLFLHSVKTPRHTFMHTQHTHTHAHTHPRTHTHPRPHAHPRTQTPPRAHTHPPTPTHTHTHTHTHTRAHTLKLGQDHTHSP